VALAYAVERKQFGRPIASFGMIQRKLADMAARIYSADSMSYRTAGLLDAAAAAIDPKGPGAGRRLIEQAVEEYTIECSILKVFGTETCDFVADEALQILGGYGFTADYAVERHYRDSRIYRIFEGTNEINRLIIPATLLKRIGQGRLPYLDFLRRLDDELANPAEHPVTPGALAAETQATERAKRVLAHTARVLIERQLASLKERQQHLEILSNMVIDLYAMDSVVNRTRLLEGHGAKEDGELRRTMTNVFVASANERVADGARRILANEFDGDELHAQFARLDSLASFFPVRTIAAKAQIADALVARGLGPIFLR
jgi:alkylation response protein AidB-like acyl-CoA dehydrogenase